VENSDVCSKGDTHRAASSCSLRSKKHRRIEKWVFGVIYSGRKVYWLQGARGEGFGTAVGPIPCPCMCYTKQKLSGCKRIVMTAVPKDGRHDTPEPELYSCPSTPSSRGVRPTYNWKCHGGSISPPVAYASLAADSSSREPERNSDRAAAAAIGEHRRFRNATGRVYGVNVADGDACSGCGPNCSRPKGR
jgi:hypothetical protein